MKSRFIKSIRIGNEKGQSILFSAFLMTAFFVVGGVGVDSANVFLKKFQAQRAVDASAMAGIARYDNGVTDITTIQNAAVQIAKYNLHQMGVSDSEITNLNATLAIDANRVATLKIDNAIKVPTFFMRFIPGAGLGTVTINTKSSSRRIPAVISLILDTSGSMAGSKIQALKDGANAFVDSFQDNIDQIALINFGYSAKLSKAMAPIKKTSLHPIINALSADGWTNTAEAVAMGRKQVELADIPTAQVHPVKAIVLFTDGAPNTLRAFFTNAKQPPLTKNYPATSPKYWDYTVYTADSPRKVVNPVTLSTVCSTLTNCFKTFAYLDSREISRPNSSSVSLSSSNTQVIKESYHLPIVETDYAKAEGITVYTIGLGTQASEGIDPYQDVNDQEKIKSYFLRRLANAPEGVNDPPFPNLPKDSSHPVGIYFQTPAPSDLVNLFQAVARRIKLRLVE